MRTAEESPESMLEKVDGAWQGASTLFLNTTESIGVRIVMDNSGKTIYRLTIGKDRTLTADYL